MAKAQSASAGPATPSTMADTHSTPISHRAAVRIGLTRYGLDTVTAAAAAARTSDGNGWTPSIGPTLSDRLGTTSSTIQPTMSTPPIVRTRLAAQSRSRPHRR